MSPSRNGPYPESQLMPNSNTDHTALKKTCEQEQQFWLDAQSFSVGSVWDSHDDKLFSPANT